MSLDRLPVGKLVIFDTQKPGGGFFDENGHLLTPEMAREIELAAQAHIAKFSRQYVEDYNKAADAAYMRSMEEPPPKLKQRGRAGFVYIMLNRRNGLTKIGFSTKPKFREATLQSQEPEIEMLGSKPGSLADEERLHFKYAALRVRGEWFSLPAEARAEILSN